MYRQCTGDRDLCARIVMNANKRKKYVNTFNKNDNDSKENIILQLHIDSVRPKWSKLLGYQKTFNHE